MAKEMKDIQQLINERAATRLRNEIEEINRVVNGNKWRLMEDIYVNTGTADKPKTIKLYHIFSSEGFSNQIFENNIEKYKAEEAQLFLQKVESLREDVDNLMNNQNYA